ncbi:hypothetical protein XENOCAPTIV_025314 [Xenoophorus captivus]|uniref:Uncharacterized protein n=1 Tax=Xenoophorus captivus TaxID=1517983 RepID=A0ABV0QUP9_9TELE
MDLYLSKPEEQFVLKQETTDPFKVTPSHVVEYYIEPEPIRNQVLSQDLCKTENQDQEENHKKDSRLNPDNEPKQNNRCQKTIMRKTVLTIQNPKDTRKLTLTTCILVKFVVTWLYK